MTREALSTGEFEDVLSSENFARCCDCISSGIKHLTDGLRVVRIRGIRLSKRMMKLPTQPASALRACARTVLLLCIAASMLRAQWAFGIGSTVARGKTTATIPLLLLYPVVSPDSNILYNATFSIRFDKDCVQFNGISAPPGSLFDGIPLLVNCTDGVLTVQTQIEKQKVIDVPGFSSPVAELTFVMSDPEGRDTLSCSVHFDSWQFEAGRNRPLLKNGMVKIVPRTPSVTDRIVAPAQHAWVVTRRDYAPNPFTVQMQLSNIGDREARKARCRIECDKDILSLMPPDSSVKNTTPLDVPSAGGAEAQWTLRAARSFTGDSVKLCVTAAFDNHDSVRCCSTIWLPPCGPFIDYNWIAAPEIRLDSTGRGYRPMPFAVTVKATNNSHVASDTVLARIQLPPEIRIRSADSATCAIKPLSPPRLNPGESGTATWLLWHDTVSTESRYGIGVWIRKTEVDSGYGEVLVRIPAIEATTDAEIKPRRVNAWTLDLFPDPAAGFLTVQLRDADGVTAISLRDATGRILFATHDRPEGSAIVRIDISGLPPGVYFIHAARGNDTRTAKFVKAQ